MIRALSLLLVVPVFAMLIRAEEKGKADVPKIQVELKKKADSVSVKPDKDRIVISVISESGIGGATLTLAEGKWSKNVVLRFQYTKQRGYDKLESLKVTTDILQFTASTSDTKIPFFRADKDGKFPGEGAKSAGTLELKVGKAEDGLEVTLPDNWFAGSKKVQLAWIDAFRQ